MKPIAMFPDLGPVRFINGYVAYHIGGGKDVYEHRIVMQLEAGRELKRNEYIHHRNGDRSDNRVENLELVTPKKHHARHGRERKPKLCQRCGKKFLGQAIKYCSVKCSSAASRRTDWPTRSRLRKLVWQKPTSIIAKQYGVSDKAIEKWCKKYGINKPPRGYWAKNPPQSSKGKAQV